MRRSTRTRSAPNDGARSVVGTASASATSKKRGANTVQYQQRAKTPEERIGKRRDDTSFSDEKKKKKTRTTATTKVIDDDSNEKKEEINDGIETTDLREKETKVGVEEEEGEDKDEKKSTEKKTKELEKEQEKKLRILLVEDDIPTSLIITSMLTQAGAVVTNASNGRQALERLRDNDYHEKIDLILTDIMMPEVDGIELCSILSKNPKLKEVPIIVMSVSDHLEATGEVLDENKALSIGAEGFLQKPLSKDVCRSVVGTHHRLLSNGSSSSSSLLLTTKKPTNDNDNNNSGSEEKVSDGSDDPSTFKIAAKESDGLVMREEDGGSNEDSGAGAGRESSGNKEEEEEEERKKRKEKEGSPEKEKMKATATTVAARGTNDVPPGAAISARELVTVPVQQEEPGTSAPKTSDIATKILHSEQKKLFSGLSVQLVRAHGGPTAVLELALPPQSHNKVDGSNNDDNEDSNDSDRVKLRRSESRSAFQSFIKQNENKNLGIETVALPIDPMSLVFPNLNDGTKAVSTGKTPGGNKKSRKTATKVAVPSRLSKDSTSPQAAMTGAKDEEAAELMAQYQMQQQQQQQQQQQYHMQMQHQQFMQMQMQFHLQQQNFMGAAQDPALAQANAQAYQNLMQSLAMSQQHQHHQMQMPLGFNPAAAAAAAMFASSVNGTPPSTHINNNVGVGMFPYFQHNQEYVNSFVQALASAVEKAPMTLLEQQHQHQHQYAPPQTAQPLMNKSAAEARLENIVSNNSNAANDNVNTASTCAERRALAIARFLKKRKERKFEKKVRYASRKRLAEARPRVRGQFVKKVAAEDEAPTTAVTELPTTNSEEEANKASGETLLISQE